MGLRGGVMELLLVSAAVQIAVLHGARGIATAGDTFADALGAAGAEVTSYDNRMVERVTALAHGPVDLVLDAAPVSNALADLVRTVQTPERVLTLSDFTAAQEVVARVSFGTDATGRNDVLGEYAKLASEGRFSAGVDDRQFSGCVRWLVWL